MKIGWRHWRWSPLSNKSVVGMNGHEKAESRLMRNLGASPGHCWGRRNLGIVTTRGLRPELEDGVRLVKTGLLPIFLGIRYIWLGRAEFIISLIQNFLLMASSSSRGQRVWERAHYLRPMEDEPGAFSTESLAGGSQWRWGRLRPRAEGSEKVHPHGGGKRQPLGAGGKGIFSKEHFS